MSRDRVISAILPLLLGAFLVVPAPVQGEGKVYVVDRTDGVSVIQHDSGAILGSIPIGGEGRGVDVTVDGLLVYVTVFSPPSVVVLDATTDTVDATIPLTEIPRAAAVTLDGTRLLVTQALANSVAVIDTSTNTVTTTIPVGQRPVQVALNNDKAYVTNQDDDTVSVIDLGSLTVATTIPVGPSPWAIAVSPDERRAYVTNYDNDSVSEIDTVSDTVLDTVSVGTAPICAAVSADSRRVFVCNGDSDTVSVIDAGSLTVIDTIPVGQQPWGISILGGMIYVVNDLAGTVSLIDETTLDVIDTIGDPGTFQATVGEFATPRAASPIFADGFESGDTCDWSSEWPFAGPPCAAFIYFANGRTVTFLSTSRGTQPLSYSWDFGDGCSVPCSTEPNPVYVYGTGGNFSVTLTVLNALGIDSITKTVTIDD